MCLRKGTDAFISFMLQSRPANNPIQNDTKSFLWMEKKDYSIVWLEVKKSSLTLMYGRYRHYNRQ